MDNEEEITITIPVKQATQRHIEHLQATLTQRNTTIEQLTARVAEAEAGEPNQEALSRAYQRGWRECANALTSSTLELARTLGKMRKDALDIYYGDRA